MKVEERIGRIITLGLFDKISEVKKRPDNIDSYVAAGNPGVVAQSYPQSVDVPDSFYMGGKRCQKSDYVCRTVFGNSMLVDGIHRGWELLLKPVGMEQIKQGDFIVINVDQAYFKHRHSSKKPLFKLKLRRAIGEVPSDATSESLIKSLDNTFAQPLYASDVADLEDSLKDARTYYDGAESLFLSITYHDSDIHYSFHPTSSIQFRVEGVAFNSDKGVQFKLPEEL